MNYNYFVSYMRIDQSGAVSLRNCNFKAEKQIASYADVSKLEEMIAQHDNLNMRPVILNFRLYDEDLPITATESIE